MRNNPKPYEFDITNPPKDYISDAIESYRVHGFFYARNVFSSKEVEVLRRQSEGLFKKDGDQRLRFSRDINYELQPNLLDAFSTNKLLDLMQYIFQDSDVSLLPPFNIARNYLPHSIYTESLGWHRDANGEAAHSNCKKFLEDSNYVFGKIGIYLQNNSEYGGAVDVIPGSNRDFETPPKGWSFSIFWIKVITFFQRYIPSLYKLLSRSKIVSKLIKFVSSDIKSGDALIFDSRTLHKGSLASKEIENSLVYNHKTLQAELPKKHTKYVLYSHFGNSIGIKSYFLDRLNRDGGENEYVEWVKDSKKIDKFSKVHPFYRKFDALISGKIVQNNFFKGDNV